MAGYSAGSPVWDQDIELTESENDFYIMAYDLEGALIGLDFLKVYLVDPSLIKFRIGSPADKVLIMQDHTLAVVGETPSLTRKIYRNGTEISFSTDNHTPANIFSLPWTDSAELPLGENHLEYQAVDESGQEIGRDGLLVICNGIMRIVKPVADSTTYATSEETIRILLQIDQPTRGSSLTINNTLLLSYNGQSTVNYLNTLQEGDNRFIFKLFDENGTQEGYSAITIRKTEIHKEKVGAGFCFIRSVKALVQFDGNV